MGGEGTNRVYGQNEAWDPMTERWEAHAPMLTPRHGMGAVVLGDAIHVAGGGPADGRRREKRDQRVILAGMIGVDETKTPPKGR